MYIYVSLHQAKLSISEDAFGNQISVPYQQLDKMRVSCHTLREFRPGIGGQLCEVLYQLITSLDCFTLSWKASNADTIDHYRVYQIKIDSGVAKLLGHVTEPSFKVTWFEIPDYEKDQVSHHFKFVVRPVLKNGIAVPLDYNYCKQYQVASKKETALLVIDSASGTQDIGEQERKESNGDDQKEKQNSCEDGHCAEKAESMKIESKDKNGNGEIESLTQKLHISDK